MLCNRLPLGPDGEEIVKITQVATRHFEVKDADEIAIPAARQAMTRQVVVMQIRTDAGIDGIGVCFVFRGLARGLLAVAEELAEAIVGEDPLAVEAIQAKLCGLAWQLSNGGLFRQALSAIDCALWDIKGKDASQPLWKMLGGHASRVPTYASGFLQRWLSDDDLVRSAEDVVAKGFRHIKAHLPGSGLKTTNGFVALRAVDPAVP